VVVDRFVAPGAQRNGRFAIPFTADEEGRFLVEEVPVGTVKILFPYEVLVDVVDAHAREVVVAEGETTEVDLALGGQ
jgi:hypothetical protein